MEDRFDEIASDLQDGVSGEMVKRCASLRSMNGWPVWRHDRADLVTCPRKPEKHGSRLPA
jgi:hypothetical protein